MNALGTEYFVLQSTASSTISESGSRVSIYLSSLASGLVALGFASSSPRAFASLAFTVLPTVFVLGWFTIIRLIDTSVANIVSLRRMELIRAYYAALTPVAPPYFGLTTLRRGSMASLRPLVIPVHLASMVITVNCVLGGATIALLFDLAFKVPLPAAAGIGVAVGLILLALSLRYEHRRLTPVVLSSYVATAMTGSSPGVT